MFISLSGQSLGRYSSSQLRPDTRPDCYRVSLTISDVVPSDARYFHLVSSNDRGTMRFPMKVEVSIR